MKIRAHHLLCMQGFQGYGYSDDFTRNMAETIKNLNSNPQQRIELTVKRDIICSCCPHNKKERCKNLIVNQNIMRMDRKVLRKIGLDEGTSVTACEIFSLVNKQFETYNDIEEVLEPADGKKNASGLFKVNNNKIHFKTQKVFQKILNLSILRLI